MFTFSIWSDDSVLKDKIKTMVDVYEDFTFVDTTMHIPDVLVIDIRVSKYAIKHISDYLKQIHHKSIIILLDIDTKQVLDAVGISIYQYILIDKIQERLPSCIQSIQQYLVNISTICIHVHKEKMFVPMNDIYAVIYEEGIVYLVVWNHELSTQFVSLEKIKLQLGNNFVFVNRNTLVNITHITSITETSIKLDNASTFIVSRRRKKPLIVACEARRSIL